MIRILLVDDHAMMRLGIKSILEQHWPEALIAEASDATEAFRLVHQQIWDVVIADLALPGQSGLDVIQQLTQSHPHMPVIVLSMHSEEQFGIRAFRAGAAGYLTKDSDPQQVVTAVATVLRGETYFSLALRQRLERTSRNSTLVSLHAGLSHREFEVLCHIASGKTLTETATHMKLSVKTIATYRARILNKMGLRSNAELIHYAIQNHLVDF